MNLGCVNHRFNRGDGGFGVDAALGEVGLILGLLLGETGEFTIQRLGRGGETLALGSTTSLIGSGAVLLGLVTFGVTVMLTTFGFVHGIWLLFLGCSEQILLATGTRNGATDLP
jgi:hypothetical protein